ncbi:MAG: tRNA pseudouridine(38-40) synthase TruA [Rhodocyclaceae bacterium]|nr:tRNA pseudouridine(38-40) synthase TruA [Rhodocyclaceae bacterium]
MVRIALGLEYDGSGFAGWQSQPHGNTLQDALETALARIAGERLRVVCAGRTDAGVHAFGQVVHFDTSAERPMTAWVRGVNAGLPATMSIRWAHAVPDAFHARFSARARSYRYLLLDRGERPGLWQGKVGWCHRPLDVAAMQEAAQDLLGEHDFSAFRAAECQAKSPVKTIHRLTVERRGEFVVIECTANAFLHHMMRNIVGALVYVGLGRRPRGWMRELLAMKDRRLAAPTYAAEGLYLLAVDYDPCWGLPLVPTPFLLPGHAK